MACEKCELYREKVQTLRDELVTEIDQLREWQDQAIAFIGRYHVYNLNPAERAEAERLLRTDP